jgi:transposase
LVAQTPLAQYPGGRRRGRGGPDQHLDRRELRQGSTVGLRRKRGALAQAIGLSRGGKTTKIHLLTDLVGRPFRLRLTAGNVSDIKAAPALLAGLTGAKHLLADKGYDADHLRQDLRAEHISPVIPGRSNRKHPIDYDKDRYKERHLVENAFCRIKDFRRVATRYDKLAANFLSTVALACLLGYWL